MKKFLKSYLFRATLFAGLALILGLTLSYIVYNSSIKIEENTFELVNTHIPILNSANQISEILIEQERNIYEYFTTQDSSMFLKKHKIFNKNFAVQFSVIAQEKKIENQSKLISHNQKQISVLSEVFNSMVQGRDNLDQNGYWDELRELLAQISSIRREMLPALQSVKTSTKQAVIRAQNATQQQVTTNHTLVIFYSFSIILLGGLIAWYIRQSILNNAKITISLFSFLF